MDRFGNGVPNLSVVFTETDTLEAIASVTAVTDSNGVATATGWQAYFHKTGSHTFDATAGQLSATFSVNVFASGSPYDGVYDINVSGSGLGTGLYVYTIADGKLSASQSYGGIDDDGSALFGQVLSSQREFVGTFTIDTSGKARGSGTMTYTLDGSSIPNLPWSAERR